ncbi:MAG: hypothetical protein J0H55_14460 [Chitinophagaceae bacterium]|nr:hypothetical protein [Chitinophagaceae bacterium]
MKKLFKILIAGLAAKRYGNRVLGGGCLGAIVVFIVVYWLLGNFHC